MKVKAFFRALVLLVACLVPALVCVGPSQCQAPNPNPPSRPVKLIFIHHSTGGNWLANPSNDQPSGGLGIALRDNNYFVSATNYGWGPDAIGDRTDIPNWPEWFTGPKSSAYLKALYSESGQNVGDFGAWSRMARDPDGENEIIMFKSCFPNSDLYGNPGDAPAAEPNEEFTVSNAKAVYNRLLTYFATRQDKLFIIITAPPMADFEYGGGSPPPAQRAANARALNNWLMNQWLVGYAHANVAVFDYFNVLTSNGGSPDVNDLGQEGGNHHRWRNGRIEHVQNVASDFSAYPSGDSHPSSAGQRKAAAEFVPLLNVFYHRWKDGAGAVAPVSPAPKQPTQPTPTSPPQVVAQPSPTSPPKAAIQATPTTAPQGVGQPTSAVGGEPAPQGLIEGWEDGNSWECSDDGQGSKIRSAVDARVTYHGKGALRISYDIVPDGYAQCGTSFERAQNWSGSSGIALALRADAAGLPLTVLLFSGKPDAYTPFVATVETTAESVSGWTHLRLSWDRFTRAEWADPSEMAKLDPARIIGMGINLTQGKGTLWVDDVALFTGEAAQPTQARVATTATSAPTRAQPIVTATAQVAATAAQAASMPSDTPAPARTTTARGLPCTASVAVPLTFVLAAWVQRRR